MKVRVESYAGYKADERPLRFFLDERPFAVEAVLDQWYSPDAIYFRVQASDGNHYVLRHRTGLEEDSWTLEAFRQVAKAG